MKRVRKLAAIDCVEIVPRERFNPHNPPLGGKFRPDDCAYRDLAPEINYITGLLHIKYPWLNVTVSLDKDWDAES